MSESAQTQAAAATLPGAPPPTELALATIPAKGKGAGKGKSQPTVAKLDNAPTIDDPRPSAAASDQRPLAVCAYSENENMCDQIWSAGFLGNCWEVVDGVEIDVGGFQRNFRNAEAAFQATRFWDHADEFVDLTGKEARDIKLKGAPPSDSTFAGLGNQWNAMLKVLRAKFARSAAAEALLSTGDCFLLEHDADNVWSDNMDGAGTNWRGIQHMLIRDELSKSKEWTNYIQRLINLDTGAPLNETAATRWQDAVRAASKVVNDTIREEETAHVLKRFISDNSFKSQEDAAVDDEIDCMYYCDACYNAVKAVPSRCKRALSYVDTKWDEFKEWAADWDPLQDMIDRLLYMREASVLRYELWLLAYDDGRIAIPPANLWTKTGSCLMRCGFKRHWLRKCLQPPEPLDADPSLNLNIDDVYFSPEEVKNIFRKRRPTNTGYLKLFLRAFCADAPMWLTAGIWAFTAVFVVILYFLLALIVFSNPPDFALESGALIVSNSSAPDAQPIPLATAATVRFRTLGDYPWLGLDELRMAEDVVLDFDGIRRTLGIAHVARDGSGVVRIAGVDGSAIRVDTLGRIYWNPPGAANETRLVKSELWPSQYSRDANPNLAVSGFFTEYVGR